MSGLPERVRRDLEEAALLPEGDPLRAQILGRVAESMDAASLDAVLGEIYGEHEALGGLLSDVELPEGICERVRSVRYQCVPRRRGSVGRVVIAASVAVLIGITVMLLVRGGSGRGFPDGLGHLVDLAVADHAGRPDITSLVSVRDGLDAAAGDGPAIGSDLPAPEPGARLLGGRLCRFDEVPVVYTRWETDSGEVALYQLRHGSFGLRPGMSDVEIAFAGEHEGKPTCDVRLWTDDRYAYIVIDDRVGVSDE